MSALYCVLRVLFLYYIFKKFIFIFSGQLLVLLSLSVQLILYCVLVRNINIYSVYYIF